jgi:predicted Fe-Mo cluster-binding NifX family protein
LIFGIPVKTNGENPAIAPTFGKVKFFAIVNGDEVKIVENVEKSGMKAVQLLLDNGVNVLLMSHIGGRPLEMALQSGIDVRFVGKDRITISEAVSKIETFPKATEIDSDLFTSH